MLHRTAILYLTLPLAMPCTTMAQPSATPPSQHASASAGYGSYIIAVDAVIVASAMTLDSEYVLIGGYLLSGPVFHIGHGRPGAAFASLALRATLPALGMLAGAAVTGGGRESWLRW